MPAQSRSLDVSVADADALMRELAARCAVPDPLVADLAEHSVLRTTVARIQELLSVAQEYQEVLDRRIAATRSRLKADSEQCAGSSTSR